MNWAPDSGAPLGNTNAVKQGVYTRRESTDKRRRIEDVLRRGRQFIRG